MSCECGGTFVLASDLKFAKGYAMRCRNCGKIIGNKEYNRRLNQKKKREVEEKK